MATAPKSASTVSQLPNSKHGDNSESLTTQFSKRKSKELVIAFSGPIGCGIKSVIEQAQEALEAVGYQVFPVKLSAFIEEAISKKVITLPAFANGNGKDAKVGRYERLQDGGNELRNKFGTDILAEYAIDSIASYRYKDLAPEDDIKANPPEKIAYLIDQIKHPAEIELLRTVYRNLFYVVGVISVEQKRKHRLITSEGIPESKVSALMERDRKEEDKQGQQLDKALQLADFFIRNDRNNLKVIRDQTERLVRLIHGENGISPTKQEYGMYVAYAAGLKSACLSRQVGAAIADFDGEIISTGCNDVPKAGGGLYSAESGIQDHRCVHHSDQICFNDFHKSRLKEEIRNILSNYKLVALNKAIPEGNVSPISDAHGQPDGSNMLGPKSGPDANTTAETTTAIAEEANNSDASTLVDEIYKNTGLRDLIEFSRSVHAEMDAIIGMARSGSKSISGATLYTTTFPCHSCARHIVASGISKVYYIEPYEKSLAKELHSDAIEFDTEEEVVTSADTEGDGIKLVKFVHFEGVAPRQYLNFFRGGNRKTDDGKVIKIRAITSEKLVPEYLDDYFDFEAKVVERLHSQVPYLGEK